MELRHLRYFVAVAEAGSFTQAAEKRLHTAQPSLSRQMHDLEDMLKVQLMIRGPRGMTLTPAGQVFLDHAKAILMQVDSAIEAARRAHAPAKTRFTVGFLTGHEIVWLPKVLQALGDTLEKIELIVHSASSPELIEALLQERMDIAFLRPESQARALAFRPLIEEELFALVPADHPLARKASIRRSDIRGEPFISFNPAYSPALRRVIDDYLRDGGIEPTPMHEAETLPMVISLILSSRGVTFLPAYMSRLLPASVVGRPLAGKPPTIPLALGYRKNDPSPLLENFLLKANNIAD